MFGKPEWFMRRKYSGWGVTPKTWQGWVYILVAVIPLFIISRYPGLSTDSQRTLMLIWVGVLMIDVVDIMFRVNKDEREKIHEAFAERNALWAMLLVLTFGISYQVAQSIAKTGQPSFDPFVIAAILMGLVAKAITNIYLDRKD